MMLLVDIGNTRVKWTMCADDRSLGVQQALPHDGWSVAQWRDTLFGTQPIARVVAATVAGENSRRKLEQAAALHGVMRVEFAASTAAALGVRNAYPDPRLLGVDRWVAVIGAYERHRRACCVVDVGTAMTVDAVAGDGQHLGGFIVPGPRLMVRSLHSGTSDLAAHSAASVTSERSLFADNTHDAIVRGSRVALAALVDRAQAELAGRSEQAPAILCTGGAVDEVLPYVLAAVEVVPDLVLQGLACLARARA